MNETPETLMQAVRYFADLSICDAYMRRIKWAGKPVCPACGSDRIGEIVARHKLQCKGCRKQFSHKVGTIFEDSPLGLDKWFVAVWCIANARNGISSHELGRALGVTQKTAWFMLHRIREAMGCKSFDKFWPVLSSVVPSGWQAVDIPQAGRHRGCWIHGDSVNDHLPRKTHLRVAGSNGRDDRRSP